MNALTFATAQLLRVLPRERITRTVGDLAERRWTKQFGKTFVDAYCKLYDVDLAECGQQGGWSSFDSFFTRSLRDGARSLDRDPRVILSPADGRLDTIAPIDEGATFQVKGRPYRVAELVGDETEAARYLGGQGCVVYLSPRDYHRVHAPVGGTIAHVRSIAGDYFPVNGIGLKHIPNLFVRNRRVSIAIDTPASTGLGRVTVIMVAAIVVGRITVTGVEGRDVPYGFHEVNVAVEGGEEIGIFHLGSTAVLLFEKGKFDSFARPTGPIRFGEALATVRA